MRCLKAFPLLALALTAACVGESPDVEESTSSRADELVGGHVATESEYPSTVHTGGCTAVKVGPRHFLTAAHCLGTEADWFSGHHREQSHLLSRPDGRVAQPSSRVQELRHLRERWVDERLRASP